MAKKIEKLKKDIIAATKVEPFYAMVNKEDVQPLVDAGHVEINPNVASLDGKVAARATEALINAPVAEVAPKQKLSFEIVDAGAVPLPVATSRTSTKPELYPFSKLEVGQSFVVPATEANPKPEESFGTTVASAIRRFSEKTGQTRTTRKGKVVDEMVPTRKFVLKAVKAGDKYENGFVEPVSGARVFRTA